MTNETKSIEELKQEDLNQKVLDIVNEGIQKFKEEELKLTKEEIYVNHTQIYFMNAFSTLMENAINENIDDGIMREDDKYDFIIKHGVDYLKVGYRYWVSKYPGYDVEEDFLGMLLYNEKQL